MSKIKRLTLLKAISILSVIFFLYACFVNSQDSLWRDEAFTGLLVQFNANDVIRLMAVENNPPLHPTLLRGLVNIFGNNEIVLRSLSFISIIIAGILLRRHLKNPVLKEISTILYFSSPYAFIFSYEARYYALFILTTFICYKATQTFIHDQSKRNIAFYALAAALVLYSHSLGILVFLTNNIITLITFAKQKSFSKNLFFKYFISNLIPTLLFVPWLFIVIKQFSNLKENDFWVQFDPISSLIETFKVFFYTAPWNNIPKILEIPIFSLFILYILVFIIGTYYLLKKKRYGLPLSFFLPFILIYIISFKQPLLYIRYVLFVLPFFIIISSYGIRYFSRKLSFFFVESKSISFIKNTQVAIAASLLILNILTFALNYNGKTKPPFKELRTALTQKIDLKEYKMVNDNEYSFFQCQYYLTMECYILKDYDDISKSIGTALEVEAYATNEEKVKQFDKIVLLYWNDTKPAFEFQKGYIEKHEVHVKSRYERLNALVLEKT